MEPAIHPVPGAPIAQAATYAAAKPRIFSKISAFMIPMLARGFMKESAFVSVPHRDALRPTVSPRPLLRFAANGACIDVVMHPLTCVTCYVADGRGPSRAFAKRV